MENKDIENRNTEEDEIIQKNIDEAFSLTESFVESNDRLETAKYKRGDWIKETFIIGDRLKNPFMRDGRLIKGEESERIGEIKNYFVANNNYLTPPREDGLDPPPTHFIPCYAIHWDGTSTSVIMSVEQVDNNEDIVRL